MPLSPEDLQLLARTEEVEIETSAPNGDVHRTTIWVVVDGSDVFIRSYRGAGARWYREVTANPSVAIMADDRRIPATAIPATDPTSITRTSDALASKYATDPATPDMLRDEVLGTTLRLVAPEPA